MIYLANRDAPNIGGSRKNFKKAHHIIEVLSSIRNSYIRHVLEKLYLIIEQLYPGTYQNRVIILEFLFISNKWYLSTSWLPCTITSGSSLVILVILSWFVTTILLYNKSIKNIQLKSTHNNYLTFTYKCFTKYIN